MLSQSCSNIFMCPEINDKRKSNDGLCNGTWRSSEIKEGIGSFFISSSGGIFFLDIVNFSIFGPLLSCFLEGDGGVRVSLAAPGVSNDAFVGTSAPCSKAELQPADPAVYNLKMSKCN